LVIRAEQLVETAPNFGELLKTKQMSLRRKLKTKFSDKRTRSVLSLNSFRDELGFGEKFDFEIVLLKFFFV